MAVILRDLGVPRRIAQGYLPGSRDLNAATETILFSDAHAWVEVYFPGYGWLPFDPTGIFAAGAAADGRSDREPRRSARARASSHRRGRSPPAAIPPAGRRRVDGGPARWVRSWPCWRCCCWSSGASRSWLAARAARRNHGGRGLRHGHADRVAVRLRTASEPDGLRVRGCPQRCPADRPPRAGDGRAGQGRIRLRPRDPR
jgi:hypothetical protein